MRRSLLVDGEGWHPGVVGIVAGRLKERFAKPAFVAGFEGGMGRGSARSIPGIDIGAIVRAAREAEASSKAAAAMPWRRASRCRRPAGRPSARFHRTRTAFRPSAHSAAASDLVVDAVSSPAGGTVALVEEIARRGPFGAGNPEPLLALPDVRVAFADVVGGDM